MKRMIPSSKLTIKNDKLTAMEGIYDSEGNQIIADGGSLVEGNPSVPEGTTPTALTGISIQNDGEKKFFSIEAGGSEEVVAYEGVLQLPTDVVLTDWTLARAIQDGNILWITLCGQIRNNTQSSQSITNVYSVLLPSSIGDKIFKADGNPISQAGGSNQITQAVGIGGTASKIYNIGCSAVNTIMVGFSSSQSITAGQSYKVDLRIPLFLNIGE